MTRATIVESDGSQVDEDGEPMIGWFYWLTDDLGNATGAPMGPYGSADEAEQAAQDEFNGWEQFPGE